MSDSLKVESAEPTSDLSKSIDALSLKEQIDKQNSELVRKMTEEERQQNKRELLEGVDSKTLELLVKRSERKYGKAEAGDVPNGGVSAVNDQIVPANAEHGSATAPTSNRSVVSDIVPTIEGDGKWIGGYTGSAPEERPLLSEDSAPGSPNLKSALRSSRSSSTSEKKVRFNNEATVKYLEEDKKHQKKKNKEDQAKEDDEWEDIEYLDDEGPSYDSAVRILRESPKRIIEHARFPKRKDRFEPIDLDDPNFNEKLHEKFFPDLPKNVGQLEWMSNKHVPETPSDLSYDSLDDLRFDFTGEIITGSNIAEHSKTTSDGLHNHSAHPELPGYTLPELAQYLRSTYPGQRCIASRTLGRIMYKLGTLHYSVTEVTNEREGAPERQNRKAQGEEGLFEEKCWEIIIQLGILDLLNRSAADTERNVSVRNYAIEALWLWNKAGGEEICKKVADEMERKRKIYQV
ncbi:DEKNAAC103763 [Brettanomyces naardenensis]|uniref:DEKNAAC103763 n=1 Tax=Brettanomyces naardenensis TaxID=13370 RepID=A0A448YP97_BRENA|nr:DEKNAAC103763 [Brettanomyces naardenensis]